jgi:hypothetical protein
MLRIKDVRLPKRIYLAAGFFAFGAAGFLAAFGAAGFFAAAGFLAAAGLAAFGFAAGFFAAGLAAAFGFGAAFFAAGLVAAGFLADFTTGFLTFAPAAFGFLATVFFAAAFFGLAAAFFFSPAGFFGFTTFSFLAAAASLNEPDAPLPLTWTSCPLTTADFRNFLMNGANFSTSALYWAEMYFLMACSELPPRSFRVLMAATTMSLTGGWLLGTFGFFGLSLFGFAAFFAFGGDATGAGAGAGSDILFVFIRFEFTSREFL